MQGRISSQPDWTNKSSSMRGKMMDFAPVRANFRPTSPILTEQEKERRLLAQRQLARREVIKRQIEEKRREEILNIRRIEAAKNELSQYQAAEEARSRELELERQKEVQRQALARREATEQMIARRHAAEQEAHRRLLFEQKRREKALERMKQHESANQIKVSRSSSTKPRQTTPFFTPSLSPPSVAQSASVFRPASISQLTSTLRSVSSLVPDSDKSISRSTPKATQTPSSRIQVVASPERKLYGRIRPVKNAASLKPQGKESPDSRYNIPHKTDISHKTEDLDELLLSAFGDFDTEAPSPSSKTSPSSKEYSPSLGATSSREIHKSPFINLDKIEKRPLSESMKEKSSTDPRTSLRSSTSRLKFLPDSKDTDSPRKNVYKKNASSPKQKTRNTVIIEDKPRGAGLSLAIAITLMIILGTIVGTLVYFAFFQ